MLNTSYMRYIKSTKYYTISFTISSLLKKFGNFKIFQIFSNFWFQRLPFASNLYGKNIACVI